MAANKAVNLARAAVVASALWSVKLSRGRADARTRKARSVGTLLTLACGGLAAWAVRRSLRPGAPRPAAEAAPGLARGTAAPAGRARSPAREAGRAAPKPSAKKQRKRTRQNAAEIRAKMERDTPRAPPVKVEVNQAEELKAPLGELLKS